ncbi:MAG: diaminopimelate decarboxylase [Eubacteriales bacterium]|nr:diaminopimelate decarboxylase [Eubacteriales bacterium]
MLYDCLGINERGHLTIGGLDTVSLAREYGTPLYVMDEDYIRRNCRIYKKAVEKFFGGGSFPLYASKALSFKHIYRIMNEEDMGIDVVSSGELYTALSAGFPPHRIYFHGNNKTDADIKYGIESDVGCFAADSREELDCINSTAATLNKKQKAILRVSPGINPQTHRKIITGSVDSKFGSAIITGQALELVKYALSLKSVDFAGIHCHIGSQIFENETYFETAEIMIKFIADIKGETGFEIRELNLGGGFGVRYIEEHPQIDYAAMIGALAKRIDALCAAYNIKRPEIKLEPGRSIVAASGITLYTVGSVKEITGYKNYVSVDGGMTDNPRYALYSSPCTAVIAGRAGEKPDYRCTVAGRCCESGDLLAENIKIQPCSRGDILAVLVTGAYNYSMASNYNRIPRPPVIMVSGGKPFTAVRRETFDDIVRCDM